MARKKLFFKRYKHEWQIVEEVNKSGWVVQSIQPITDSQSPFNYTLFYYG